MDLCVVVVTYNRLSKLKKALAAYERQMIKPRNFIVVDNNSNDGTGIFLDQWREVKTNYPKTIIKLSENIGGSGGFYYGLKKALEFNNKWIWVADDDAYPHDNAFFELDKVIDGVMYENVAAICGSVRNTDGNISIGHRRRLKIKYGIIRESFVPDEEYSQDKFELDLFTYVGTVINTQKMREIGLPIKEYFIWFDDSEHSLRMKCKGTIVCFPQIKVTHDEKIGNADWKEYYYGYRNRLDMYFRHYPKLKLFNLTYWLLMVVLTAAKKRSCALTKMQLTAIKDTCTKNFGRHPVYGPSYK